MIHFLKTWPQYFQRVLSGEKQFEVRKNDRDFQAGDTLVLQEYDPETNSYTGGEIYKKVSYILYGGNFGIEKDFVVMSIDDKV